MANFHGPTFFWQCGVDDPPSQDEDELSRVLGGPITWEEIRSASLPNVHDLARALFDYDHADEAAECGEAWDGPEHHGVRICRPDFDERMTRALDVMWTRTKLDAQAEAQHRAHFILARLARLR